MDRQTDPDDSQEQESSDITYEEVEIEELSVEITPPQAQMLGDLLTDIIANNSESDRGSDEISVIEANISYDSIDAEVIPRNRALSHHDGGDGQDD